MEAGELARWTRFAVKGGIGKCTAVRDCVAESTQDLMFLKVRFGQRHLALQTLIHNLQGDDIVVLMQVAEEEGVYLVCN